MPAAAAEVYPRVCGGTSPATSCAIALGGLSPRVRGNPPGQASRRGKPRSIPACAGEPNAMTATISVSPVYPRVCGGTSVFCCKSCDEMGLSPRVRGNPEKDWCEEGRWGSIPACAGEPRHAGPAPVTIWVYPRVCGGTGGQLRHHPDSGGLSPRVRGNPEGGPGAGRAGGSIPACAGEPRGRPPAPPEPEVYPRVCGGTSFSRSRTGGRDGLSPRVRGNRVYEQAKSVTDRSIPACAGEPGIRTTKRARRAVYPRVCGGTWGLKRMTSPGLGLSPRVRGNRCGWRRCRL